MVDGFLSELKNADQRRREVLAAITTKPELGRLQEKVRHVLHAAYGAFPERTPLNARQTGEILHDDYAIEKIVFESQPGYYVPANVYRPKTFTGRRPGLVHACGHYDEGKAKDDYQRASIGLVRRGFIVLIFDPLGQGERLMYRRPGEKPPRGGEHTLAGKAMLLLGRNLANYFVWDAVRALDYLETRPDVDPSRMGMFGHSGGGSVTYLTAPIEPRIRAAVSCCAVTAFYHIAGASKLEDPEQVLPRIYAEGVDHPEILTAIAPRPLLIGAVLHERSTPLEGTRRTFEETKHSWAILGAPGNLRKVESDNIHMFDQTLREACYGWMLQHLAGEAGDTREQPMQLESPESLRCTKTGAVMDLERARSVFDLNLSYANELRKRRPAKASLADVKRLLAIRHSDARPGAPTTVIPGGAHRDVLIVLVCEQGRNSGYANELSRALAASGCTVLGIDLCGWGEATPTRARPDKRTTWDEYFAWTASQLGRSLPGMRVAGLLSEARRHSREYRKIYLAGVEGGGLIALHAAAIEPLIAGVATNRTLDSYHGVLEHPVTAEPEAGFVADALTCYDLPQLAALVEPRPCVAVDPFDCQRRPVSGQEPVAGMLVAQKILRAFGLGR
jgi:cephalosporin-C deacetylase-like acetyl esterase